jgi:hypothetical protein
MLLYTLLKALVDSANVVFGYLPDGSQLPTWFGVNLDYLFASGIDYIKLLAQIFPPFITIMIASSIYLTWRIILLGLKVVLGSRVPAKA